METLGGESSVNTNDELNKLEVSPNMDSYVVDYVTYSSLDATLKETCGLRYKDVIAMKFDSVEDAGAFYHGCSRAVGPLLQTRADCKARFSVSLDCDTNKYNVRAFEENHCHKLVTFRESKASSETNFYCRFSTNEKDRLDNIFWRDLHSLFEYQCFGDVLVFDLTYKTNASAKPLVLFVGVNNHHATCVFGVALLSDETMQLYIWALNTFMESMGHKQPISILTDRDEAM
ncbi:hypothetical protein Dsin_005830 [Dipteronia sinensis]|uniref:MULE transposase domain-containing protein n=1 Tax=Dipteronia sinensis TaxID=43782 RepID=A0AAE0EEZ9_9ROSI|nr:hypothetical protein Dsin_005830 [Dipteronia sinensis]